ncbi:MAG: segregation/condensation protein A [Parcubacteria group bacterium]|nr:segregation/condensation protein A [Parcubacteria group bacterium]
MLEEKKEFTVTTRGFEGPLDLLLQLIEKRKLHINDISLAQITDDYLAHIEGLESFPLKEAAHFILIASTLVLIKSRSLLPNLTLTEEEEGDIRDLERRLKEYQRIKELSVRVQEQFNTTPIFIPAHIISRTPPVFSPTKKITLAAMHEYIRHILSYLPTKEIIPQAFVKKMVSVEETIATLLERVKRDMKVRFGDFSQIQVADKINVIVSFLAVLELVKRGSVLVSQHTQFGDIHIEQNTISNSPNS